jgi:hypothetical protein
MAWMKPKPRREECLARLASGRRLLPRAEQPDGPARRAASPGEHGHEQEHERDRANDSGERRSLPDFGMTLHAVVIAPLDTRRGCARITRCDVRAVVPAAASASVRVPPLYEQRLVGVPGPSLAKCQTQPIRGTSPAIQARAGMRRVPFSWWLVAPAAGVTAAGRRIRAPSSRVGAAMTRESAEVSR